MKFPSRVVSLALCLLPSLALGAGTPAPAPQRNATVLAVYVPPAALSARSYDPQSNLWIEPGEALDDSLEQVGKAYFPTLLRVPDGAQDQAYGLLLDLAPKWSSVAGKVKLSMQFNVFAPDGRKLLDGTKDVEATVHRSSITGAAYAAAREALQAVLVDTVARLQPDPTKFPPTGTLAKIDRELLVDRTRPLRTGTGFFVNAGGQLLTAAHVSRECTVLEARRDGKAFPVTRRASSELLDVAVLDSGQPAAHPLPFRTGEALVLGESVTSVGYPLQGILADSPNLTRGNVSSARGITGSLGNFQFSAPIQPGNSGGPVVSDNGELLGIAVGTLNAKSLVERGLLPQNVNFALDSRYVARFLRRENVGFAEIEPRGPGEMRIANDAALAATVQLACYQ
jgi:serine protease Do